MTPARMTSAQYRETIAKQGGKTATDDYRKLLTDRKPRSSVHARGRMKTGRMNKTEARYAIVLDVMKREGAILWWAFEAIKLRLANSTFLTVDFFVMLADGELRAIDVKGGPIEDDAAVKLKCAAENFPFRFVVAREMKGGGWSLKDVASGL